MFKYASAILLFGLPATSLAANTLQDYAYQSRLSDSAEQLQRVELPIDVILSLTRTDLGDLAVFNRHGKALPHSITRSPNLVTEHTVSLPFHEFNRYRRQHSKTVTKREQNQQGGRISAHETTETVAVQTVRKDYLIELSPDENTPEYQRIELQWKHEPASQILEVRVELGNELDSLRLFKKRKSLTNNASSDTSWTSISGFPQNKKYLRLTPAKDITRFELQQAKAHYRRQQVAPRIGYRLQPTLVTEKDGEFYHFKYPSSVMAEAMRIIPGEAHSVITGNLYVTSNNQPQRQRIHYRFRQHNISEAEVKPSKPISLPQREFDDVWFTSKADSAKPEVELIYPQYEVVFLSDDNGPYTLAWGNHAAVYHANDLRSLFDDKLDDARSRSELQTLGPITIAGGSERLQPLPELPWQKWLLWLLLLIVVAITGRMVLKLYREMNPAAEP